MATDHEQELLPTKSSVFITVEGRNGRIRRYTLPPEVIAPPMTVVIGGAVFNLEGSWQVPPQAGDPIHARYAPATAPWTLDISGLQWDEESKTQQEADRQAA